MTYTKEEQKQHRAELVEALRSGEYQQTIRVLRDSDNFCCLGVACDISGLSEWERIGIRTFNYLGEKKILPVEIMEYYGFKTQKVVFYNSRGYPENLIILNDRGFSFKEIADVIESEPEGMFV